jgi:hypothetical protein
VTSAISTRRLARGIALVISLATVQAGACELHTMTLNGLETAHPVSVPVSLATRHAIDNKRISDISRGTRDSKLAALANIEETFHAFDRVVKQQKPLAAPVFSIYLTESGHWAQFVPTELGWTTRLHMPDSDQSAVVVVVSDTAMKSLLSGELMVKDAYQLGLLVPVGDEVNRNRVLAVVQDLLVNFHESRIQKASLN